MEGEGLPEVEGDSLSSRWGNSPSAEREREVGERERRQCNFSIHLLT